MSDCVESLAKVLHYCASS